MTPAIRSATPEDVPFLAQIALLASRSHVEKGHWDIAIESGEADILRAIEAMLVTPQGSPCHYSNFLVAEVEGTPAAALSGYAAHDESMLPMVNALIAGFHAIGLRGDDLGVALRRLLVFDACMSPDEPEAWIVEWVATLAAFRRQGLVRVLLDAILERGRERGHPLAQIGIAIGNTSAQRAYEAAGFVLEYEKRSPDFEAAVGAEGMARLLLRY